MKPSLLLPEPPLQVLPSLALKIGLNEAIVLQQIHYWLNPKFNDNMFEGKHWVHNTYEEWQVQFPFWSERTVRRTVCFLEEKNLLISFVTQDFKKTKYYTLNYDALGILFGKDTSFETQETSGENDQMEELSETGQLDQDCLSPLAASRQDDQLHRPSWTGPRGQLGRNEAASLAVSYTKDTENTSETTLHPFLMGPDDNLAAEAQNQFPNDLKKEEDEKGILNQLLQIWNSAVQRKLGASDVIQTPSRLSKLQSVFDGVFDASIDRWKAYCDQIASLQFLMGKNPSGFTVTLDWALNPDNARKVLEKAIYDKPSEGSVTILAEDAFAAEITKTHAVRGYPESWTRICLRLVQRLGQPIHKSWISKLSPDALGGAVAEIRAENAFIRDYIQRAYGDAIMDAVRAECPQIRSIHLFCSGETPS